jgi:hypothetical protein
LQGEEEVEGEKNIFIWQQQDLMWQQKKINFNSTNLVLFQQKNTLNRFK